MSNRQKVLVVDDSKLIQRIAESRLRDLDVDIIEASLGKQALELATIETPDLIMLDMNLKDLPGLEVLVELKQDPRTHDIPVILLTDSVDSEHKVKGFDLGAIDYVLKPFNPAEFRARVRSALRNKAMMDMLALQAEIDGLSGLHNRRHFDARLKQELSLCRRHQHSVGLLLMDIDHFKQINDHFGHPKGDQIIQSFAALLVSAGRTSDVPCRWGGDEFAVILPMTKLPEVELVGRRFIDLLHNDTRIRQAIDRPVTCSIGAAATAPQESLSSEELIERADKALYESKQHGRNRLTVAA